MFDPEFALLVYETAPCPFCAAVGEPRQIWPQHGLYQLDVVDERVSLTEQVEEFRIGLLPDRPGEAPITCVFLCAALEALLQQVVWTMLMQFRTPLPVAQALDQRCRGRDLLLRLYGDLLPRGTEGKRSAKSVLQERDLGSWFDDWQKLTEARNRIGHGHDTDIELDDLVERVRRPALQAMSVLHNAAIDAAGARGM